MKYFIIAGEASGDLHGSNLAKNIFIKDKSAKIQAWGGDQMGKTGVLIKKHFRELAFMGFIEVLLNIRTIFRNIRLCKEQILAFKPKALILIDYPGFNLRIAAWAKVNNIKVYYYISPQIWAWKKSRVKKIKRDVKKMFVILPFEKAFYEKHNVNVEFSGHPLMDAIHDFEKNQIMDNIPTDKKILVLLPGSRKQEIKNMLPLMLKAAAKYKDSHHIIIAGLSSVSKDLYQTELDFSKIIYDQTYSLLLNAHTAFVTSGTATLETALFSVPQVVCYKASAISYQIAKQVIKVKYISLVNLIADKKIVSELIQGELNIKNMQEEMDKIINEGAARTKMLDEYKEVKTKLGGDGASKRVAEAIFNDLTN